MSNTKIILVDDDRASFGIYYILHGTSEDP
jgi:hypothetical protein